jgi:hypothetical protein
MKLWIVNDVLARLHWIVQVQSQKCPCWSSACDNARTALLVLLPRTRSAGCIAWSSESRCQSLESADNGVESPVYGRKSTQLLGRNVAWNQSFLIRRRAVAADRDTREHNERVGSVDSLWTQIPTQSIDKSSSCGIIPLPKSVYTVCIQLRFCVQN